MRRIHLAQAGAIQPKGYGLAAYRSAALRTALMLTARDRREEGVEALDQGAGDRSVSAVNLNPLKETLDNFLVPAENSEKNVVVSHSCFQHP